MSVIGILQQQFEKVRKIARALWPTTLPTPTLAFFITGRISLIEQCLALHYEFRTSTVDEIGLGWQTHSGQK
jgi:hypothetical protein